MLLEEEVGMLLEWNEKHEPLWQPKKHATHLEKRKKKMRGKLKIVLDIVAYISGFIVGVANYIILLAMLTLKHKED